MEKYCENIFPVSVYSFFRKEDSLNQELLDEIYKIRKTEENLKKSNKGGFHSLQDLHQRNIEPFNKLHDEILGISNELILKENFSILDECNVKCMKMKEMWFIINKLNDYNVIHTHGRTWLSGAYYVKVPKNDKYFLMFEDPMIIRKYENITPNTYKKEIFENMIVLFPGWLPHKVPENTVDEERIVISFNLEIPI